MSPMFIEEKLHSTVISESIVEALTDITYFVNYC
jgi:hypothetical protein